MIIGVDSSVLLGILKEKERYRSWLEFILDLHRHAQLVVCDVVYAEIAGVYRREAELQEALASLGLSYDAIRSDTAFLAGQIYSGYRRAGGPRHNLVPDFLVGAHAIQQANGLLTTDRGYLRSYFKGIKILQPDESR